MMDALKTLRLELGKMIAEELEIEAIPFGANVNPPCVVVTPGSPYAERTSYDSDRVRFNVRVFSGTGELAATADKIDDFIDGIRASFANVSSSGFKYTFESIDRPGDDLVAGQTLPDFIVAAYTERSC